jgi:hypothetical protein
MEGIHCSPHIIRVIKIKESEMGGTRSTHINLYSKTSREETTWKTYVELRGSY